MSSTSAFELSTPGFLAGACTAIVWLLFKEFIEHVFASAASILIYSLVQISFLVMVISAGVFGIFVNFWRLAVLYKMVAYFLQTVTFLLDEQDTEADVELIIGALTPPVNDEDDPSTISGLISGACAALIGLLFQESLRDAIAVAASALLYAPSLVIVFSVTALTIILNSTRLVALFEAARYLQVTATLLLEAEDTDEQEVAIPGAYVFECKPDDIFDCTADEASRDAATSAMDTSTSDETLVHEAGSIDKPTAVPIQDGGHRLVSKPPVVVPLVSESSIPSSRHIAPIRIEPEPVVDTNPTIPSGIFKASTSHTSASTVPVPAKPKKLRLSSTIRFSWRRISAPFSTPTGTSVLSAVNSLKFT
ncbi:hypothetical protein MSAN_00384700 [Mycena sanguinolenta]|uniref:Uncharacterized protein n=1 Tax=Mycena sanguinolenta TaxID=230812 RepID=A0A8H6ZDN8_9AGAR|nr:hypothetical protein MSAN_00384700 [Mycena sanguinolenta]